MFAIGIIVPLSLQLQPATSLQQNAPLVPTYIVNLDLEPEKRWTSLIKEKRTAIVGLLDILKDAFKKHKPQVKDLLDAMDSTMPVEYSREIDGIADAAGLTRRDALLANAFYEVTALVDSALPVFSRQIMRSCTSVVAQDSNGTVYLARNMDYPDPFTLIMVHAVFTRGGRTVYEGTTFAGTVGLSTGFVPGKWAVSENARDNPGHGTAGALAEGVSAAKAGAPDFTIFIRQAMDELLMPPFPERSGSGNTTETATERAAGTAGPTAGYQEALKFYSEKPLIVAGYITLAGTQPGEGAVITRNGTNTTVAVGHQFPDSDVFALLSRPADQPAGAGGTWYVAETNVDHWTHDALIFNRRLTATTALEGLGQDRVDLTQLWGVLSTYPVYNFATIHTDLTCPARREYRSYKRHGPLP
jgi:hypothetical protein